MAVLKILQFPDKDLRIKAAPVIHFDEALKKISDDMIETMYESRGVGLAGTQAGIHQRIFVMDISDTKDQAMTVINPELLHAEGELLEAEGCLSVDGAWDKIKRATKVRLRGMDLKGETFELDADGLMAKCIQHEIDHLNGILFIDHLSRLKQARIRKKIEKNQRHQ